MDDFPVCPDGLFPVDFDAIVREGRAGQHFQVRILQFGRWNRLHYVLMVILQDLVVSPYIIYTVYTDYMIWPFDTSKNGQTVIDHFVFWNAGQSFFLAQAHPSGAVFVDAFCDVVVVVHVPCCRERVAKGIFNFIAGDDRRCGEGSFQVPVELDCSCVEDVSGDAIGVAEIFE